MSRNMRRRTGGGGGEIGRGAMRLFTFGAFAVVAAAAKSKKVIALPLILFFLLTGGVIVVFVLINSFGHVAIKILEQILAPTQCYCSPGLRADNIRRALHRLL